MRDQTNNHKGLDLDHNNRYSTNSDKFFTIREQTWDWWQTWSNGCTFHCHIVPAFLTSVQPNQFNPNCLFFYFQLFGFVSPYQKTFTNPAQPTCALPLCFHFLADLGIILCSHAMQTATGSGSIMAESTTDIVNLDPKKMASYYLAGFWPWSNAFHLIHTIVQLWIWTSAESKKWKDSHKLFRDTIFDILEVG
jgi:hypothetical protein